MVQPFGSADVGEGQRARGRSVPRGPGRRARRPETREPEQPVYGPSGGLDERKAYNQRTNVEWPDQKMQIRRP